MYPQISLLIDSMSHHKISDHTVISDIAIWTENKKMMFNVKKSKTMIFNFTNQYQFTTRLSLNNNNLDVVSDTKLLRTIICDDLKWDKNCNAIIKKLYARMKLHHMKIAS